ncbi:hypothetical protein ACIA6E_00405 [Streptomyces sp. NPDC051815]|uniref:hypothetical protein n=1 Tax=Streptomyces sp. NPDC051815 TaxID=3365674 RepID=UPI0037AFAEC4
MSVNIDLAFTVTSIADEPQAHRIVDALGRLMLAENIELEVSMGVAKDEHGALFVSGESDHPLCVSRSYLWRPHFEGLFTATVEEVAAGAVSRIEWGYPDEEY